MTTALFFLAAIIWLGAAIQHLYSSQRISAEVIGCGLFALASLVVGLLYV